MLRLAAIGLIRFYQRFLSPLKGYRCAFGVAHGGKSCSAMVLELVRERPLRHWPAAIRGQFELCHQAAAQLRRRRREDPRRRRNCDACDCVPTPDLPCPAKCQPLKPDLDCCGVDFCGGIRMGRP